VSELQEVNDLEKHRKRLKTRNASGIKAAGGTQESSGSRNEPHKEPQETSVMEQDLSGGAAESQSALDEARPDDARDAPAGDFEKEGQAALDSTLVAMKASADESKEQECHAELPTKQQSDKQLDEAPATMDAPGTEEHDKIKSAELEPFRDQRDNETAKELAPQGDEEAPSEKKTLPNLTESEARSECSVEVSTCDKMELEKPHADGSGNLAMPVEGNSESLETECEATVGKTPGDCETAGCTTEAHDDTTTTRDAQGCK
jgi:hypothetical protein